MIIDDINKILINSYDLHPTDIRKSSVGAGSDVFFVSSDERKYVLKFPSPSAINHPEQEPQLCEYLLQNGIPVSQFVKCRDGSYVGRGENGILYTLQKLIDGENPKWNTAEDELLWNQAELLGKIHKVMKDYSGLQVGIGEDFFRFMTPEKALESYRNSLLLAKKADDNESENDLEFRIEMIKKLPKAELNLDMLTCAATHGDYYISQLLCSQNKINAVIDWTCACVHPLIWEVVRSYVYASPECADGNFDDRHFTEYVRHYEKYAVLNEYDLHCAKMLYFYQIAVCDYYGQYFASKADNRIIYLKQARLATKLLRKNMSSKQ